jgi:Fe2+ transport system protein B
VIINQLTGLHQHIGNWPGKTIERAEDTLHFRGYTIDIIDLPGIYSLSTFSLEESFSREFIAKEKPNLVINVVDAAIQLIEQDNPAQPVLHYGEEVENCIQQVMKELDTSPLLFPARYMAIS